MKSLRICKSTVSMILALIMLVSMCTVGIVSTSAAEVDVAETGAATTIYFQNNWIWSDVCFYAWGANETKLNGDWPGTRMSLVGNDGTYDYYKATIPAGTTGFIINGIKDDGSNTRDQSPDMTTLPDNNNFYYMEWKDKNVLTQAEVPITDKFPNEAPQDPQDPMDPSEYETTRICFRDDAGDPIDSDDADMYVQFDNGDKKLMTKTVDAMSGHDMWYADLKTGTTVKFIRTSVIDKTEWNTWTATLSGNVTGLYRATGWNVGEWGKNTHSFAIPDKEDINNYSFGIWADTVGNGSVHDCVIAQKKSDGNFVLYLPSNAPANVKLYTSFDSLNLGGINVTDGTGVLLQHQSADYTIKYMQTKYDKTEKQATLRVIRSGDVNNAANKVGTLFLETKRPLYTEISTYLGNNSGAYKDALETKGSIFLYDEDGALVTNTAEKQVLKKIKGRGNSSFEASAKLYGKYAYNFNLDKKLDLVGGATKSKKWCLLANNVDHAMLRNTFAYNLADEIGLNFSPKTRHVDVYNNGYYIGAYTIIEKVEYGGSTLMETDSQGNEIINLDDENVLANSVFEDGTAPEDEKFVYEFDTDDLHAAKDGNISIGNKNYTYVYYDKYDRPDVYDEETEELILPGAKNLEFKTPANYRECNYLLEHELDDRYQAEASWFVTPITGQAVVVKYPEFATQAEMEWIISEYAAMEQAVYGGTDGKGDFDEYEDLIDVDSFAKMYLIQELGLNLDSCATSYYIHNEFTNSSKTDSKLVAGPVWDYDWSFGSYYKTKVTTTGTSKNLDNPRQMFIKHKDKSNDYTTNRTGKYNLQAKMAQNADFWIECQRAWTNDVEPAIKNYIDMNTNDGEDTGIMLTQWLPALNYSVEMNSVRWGGTYKNVESADWGTKVTSNYEKGTYKFVPGDRNKAGDATKSYANTVYYLNDWIAVRTEYMSNEGGLLDNTLLERYEITDVSFEGVRDGLNLTVTPSAIVTKDDQELSKDQYFYTVYVNGEAATGAVPFTTTFTDVVLEEGENEVYIVVSIEGSDKTEQSVSTTYEVTIPKFTVENVKYTYDQSDDRSQVTITPSADVKFDGVTLEKHEYQYTVYLNDVAVEGATNVPFTTESVTIDLIDGQYSNVYVMVTPVADTSVSGKSSVHTFAYNVDAPVTLTIKFKSSMSYRYQPSVTYDGVKTSMTMTDECIWTNEINTQGFYWYETTISAQLDDKVELTFTNGYTMNAKVTIDAAQQKTYYFGCDNMNSGATAVELPDGDDENSQTIRNFAKSAAHMLKNDTDDVAIAYTAINGSTYRVGDVDSDDSLSILDATTIQLALVEKLSLDDTQSALGDYNLSGNMSISDATNIQRQLVNVD